MRFGNGTLAGEMFISRNLIDQLVLFHRPSIARSLRRPFRVLANLIFEDFSHQMT